MDPVPLKLTFAIEASGSDSYYIDLSQCTSLLSRKLMRQGLNWAVSSVKVTMPAASSAQGNAVYLSTLQNTWVTYNAWVKAFNHWLKQQNDAVAEAGGESGVSTYRDFKIYAEEAHQTAGVAGNLLPVSLGPGNQVGPFASPVVTGSSPSISGADWEMSEVVFPNFNDVAGSVQEATVFMHGPTDYNLLKFGLVDEYFKSRTRVRNPDKQVDFEYEQTMYARMVDDGETMSEILDNASLKNAGPPYASTSIIGGDTFREMENVAFALNSSTIQQRTFTFPGFNAPCGLIRVDQLFSDTGGTVNDLILEITLAPGDNRGYFAVPMQEC